MDFKKYINPDFVNADEVYSENVFIGNNNAVIPYINIGLMPKNPITGEQSVVDYSYYVFTAVHSMYFNASKGKLNLEFSRTISENFINEYVSFGGYKSDNGAEVKIECEGLLFYVPDNARFNQPLDFFMPIDTPNFNRNMNEEEVRSFFSLPNLPQGIKEILGDNVYTLTLW